MDAQKEEMLAKLTEKMIEYYSGDPKRIQHFLKVHSFSWMIGRGEKLGEEEQFILETAAIVHDIGIKVCEQKYGNCSGKYQELEGPPIAAGLLRELGFSQEVIDRTAYLVGHHHTYTDIDGKDYQILVEADFLVNLYEDNTPDEGIRKAYDRVFVTAAGRELCRTMFRLMASKDTRVRYREEEIPDCGSIYG